MLKKIIEKTAQALEKIDIPYMIIGGQAVLIYGEPRLTKDIDITLGIDHTRVKDIIKLISKLKFTLLTKNIENFVKKNMVLPAIDEKSGLRIDFIFSFTEYEKQALKRAKSIMLENKKVKFASIEDIIIHKIFAGRPRDLEDVNSILIKNKSFDKKYVMKWLKEFETNGNHNLLKTFNLLLKEH